MEAVLNTPVAIRRFGAQAVEMERFALAELQRLAAPVDREHIATLLRHARGIKALAEKLAVVD